MPPIMDVALGLILVYLLLSLIASSLREVIETRMKMRATNLEIGIRSLLQESEERYPLTAELYRHPLIFGLYRGDYAPGSRDLPSYIPSDLFAGALMDMVARGPLEPGHPTPRGPLDAATVRRGAAELGNPRVARVIEAALDAAGDDLAGAQEAIEAWFNAGMDRVAGWYRRNTQKIVFAIGVVVAVGLNVDTLALMQHLARDPEQREILAARAQAAARDGGTLADPEALLASYALPIGWQRVDFGVRGPGLLPRRAAAEGAGLRAPSFDPGWIWSRIVSPLAGWLMTAVAISLGAPFWFDLLNKFTVVRSTVKPAEKSPPEASEDRQAGGRPAMPHFRRSSPASAATPSSGTWTPNGNGGDGWSGAAVGVDEPTWEPRQWRNGHEDGVL